MTKIIRLSLNKCDSYSADSVNEALEQAIIDDSSSFDLNRKNALIVTGTDCQPAKDNWSDIPVYHEASVQIPALIMDDNDQLNQLKALYVKLWDKCKAIQIRDRKIIIKDKIFNLPSALSSLLPCSIDDVFIVKADFYVYGIPTAEDETSANLYLPPKYLILMRYRHRIYWITDELSKDLAVQRLIRVLEED